MLWSLLTVYVTYRAGNSYYNEIKNKLYIYIYNSHIHDDLIIIKTGIKFFFMTWDNIHNSSQKARRLQVHSI